MVRDEPTLETVLDGYRHLVRALQAKRARRGADPWAECPMTMPQLRALSLIVASDHGLSSRELATLLGVGASAITPLMDRLVEHGFARRLEDPRDRRVARLLATDMGVAQLERMAAGHADVMRDALANLTSTELQLVGAAFDVLRDAVQRPAAQGSQA